MLRERNAHVHRSNCKWVLGVCAECASTWNISVYWLRAVFLLCSLLSFGMFGIVYILMRLSKNHKPKEPSMESERLGDLPNPLHLDHHFIEDVQDRMQKHQNRSSHK